MGIKCNYITSKNTLKIVSGRQNVIIYVGTVSSTVRKFWGSCRKTSGEVRGTSGVVRGLPRSSGEPDSLPATRQICLQPEGEFLEGCCCCRRRWCFGGSWPNGGSQTSCKVLVLMLVKKASNPDPLSLVAPSTGWMLYYLCFTPSTAIGPPLR